MYLSVHQPLSKKFSSCDFVLINTTKLETSFQLIKEQTFQKIKNRIIAKEKCIEF